MTRPALWEWLLLAAMATIAMARVAATYPVFTHTVDEPVHIATGMEWLDLGRYQYEAQHPPLARIATAIGPYLDGLRATDQPTLLGEGMALLYGQEAQGDTAYFRTLALARMGILPFLGLLIFIVWRWARDLAGPGAGIAAALLLSTTPTVLAHAGLATTDLPFTALLLLALYLLKQLLTAPGARRAMATGLALAATIGSKFSALLFLPAAALPLLLAPGLPALPWRRYLKLSTLLLLCLLLGLWALYRFSWGPPTWHWLEADGSIGSAVNPFPLPAPELFEGLQWVWGHNQLGHLSYLLGNISQDGWWYYFPLAVAVKTPLALLILSLLGLSWALWKRAWPVAVPALSALLLIAVSMPASINIGVRHVLPVLPLLTITAAVAAVWLWQAGKAWLTAPLLAWQVLIAIQAHPDYLAHFNPLAGSDPSTVLIDSNLDWGQDIKRLADTSRELGVETLYIALLSGGKEYQRHGLPDWRPLPQQRPVSGWIAISATRLRLGSHTPPHQPYAWLNAHKPVAYVGKSIRLYHIQPESLIRDTP